LEVVFVSDPDVEARPQAELMTDVKHDILIYLQRVTGKPETKKCFGRRRVRLAFRVLSFDKD